MKRMTLLAAMAVCGLGFANAQFVGDPSLEQTKDKGEVFDIFQLDAASVEILKNAGKTVHEYTLDNVTRCFYVWENTFVAGDGSYPGVDFQMDGYTSLEVVAGTTWSGAGFTVVEDGGNNYIDLNHISDDTRFHMGLRSSNPASAIAVIFGDGQLAGKTNMKWSPAKLSVGNTAFVDGGATYPLVGDFDREGSDWVAIDMSLADMKKFYPSFDYTPCNFSGNMFSVLGGSVAGTNISIDAVYLYGPQGQGSVEGVATDDVQVIVSNRTINVLGNENNGFELYNISGQLVKKSTTSIMGVEDLNAGLYIVKAGNVVEKVVVK